MGRCLVVLLGFLPVVLAIDGGSKSSNPKFNILFLIADQWRFDILHHHGQVIAPNLAALAKESLYMKSAYSSTPTCEPARAAILTGRSPWRHGMLGKGEIPLRYPVELPRTLAKGGYHTVSVGKNHFGWNTSSDSGIDHGYNETIVYDGTSNFYEGKFVGGVYDDYDRWWDEKKPGQDPTPPGPGLNRWNGWRAQPFEYEEHLHPTAWTGRTAVKFIEEQPMGNQQQQPWMLKVSFHRPHSPYDPPKRVLESVKAEDVPLPRLCKAARGLSDRQSNESGEGWCLRFRGGNKDCGPDDPQAWCGEMPEDEVILSRRAYFASARFVDEWVGQILEALKRRGLSERTWILFTSDHGDSLGDMFHWRKGNPYESSSHVPMLLRWPEQWESLQKLGSVVARGTAIQPPIVTEMRDIFHTFVDAAGLSNDASLVPPRGSSSPDTFDEADGKSLLCLLTDPTGLQDCKYAPNPGPWRKWVDMEHTLLFNVLNHWSALTDGRTKYIFHAYQGDEQLFDLTMDPFETEDLAKKPEHARELEKWRARLVEQFQREDRGNKFVKGGRLLPRPKVQYSPHLPIETSLSLSDVESSRTCRAPGSSPGKTQP